MSDDTRATDVVHWFGEPGQGPSTLHGNGPAHLGRGSGDEDEVTCRLCLSLLARNEHRSNTPDLAAGGEQS